MASADPKAASPSPPPVVAIWIMYIVLGSLVSFGMGRQPAGSLPDDMLREVAPTMIVIVAFLTSYSLHDCMTVGLVKDQFLYKNKRYADLPERVPEQVYLAQRVQTNQVEQMPLFLVGSLACAVFVHGPTAAVLAAVWALLRRAYAAAYRAGANKTLGEIGVASLHAAGLLCRAHHAHGHGRAVSAMLFAVQLARIVL